MDYTKALAAIEAIREMHDRYPFGLSPNPDTMADAEKEIRIIRAYCPSCANELHSLAGWLKILFTKAQHDEFIQRDRRAIHNVNTVKGYVLGDLERIEAKVKNLAERQHRPSAGQ